MNSINLSLKELYAKYKEWACKNPQKVVELESTLKLFSLFISGTMTKSVVLHEFIHSAANLLSLFNSELILPSFKEVKSAGYEIRVWLTIVYHSEVFIEKLASAISDEKGRWTIITCIQILKCVLKLILLLHHKEKVICHPPIPQLKTSEKSNLFKKNNQNLDAKDSHSFYLKRSGRIVRKIESAPSIQNRLWKPPLNDQSRIHDLVVPDKKQLQQHLIGELIHTAKPIIHLLAIRKYGSNAWKQWLIPLAMELCSLYCLRHQSKAFEGQLAFTEEQQFEIKRRCFQLLLYLMKSPFYENHSEAKLNAILDALGKVIPVVPRAMKESLVPFWRETFFYMWSS